MRDLTYFISDLHLGAAYIADPRAHEQRVVRFLRSIAPRTRRLYLLGDILDYWWEYRNVVPRGYVRFLGQLARMADDGVQITWLKGNHDVWIDDYLPNEIGMRVHDGVLVEDIDGRRFLMEHGDGVGRLPAGFRALRRLFRCRTAQRMYAAVHPRWTMGLAHAWSAHSRKKGGYVAPAHVADNLQAFAEAYNRRAPGARVRYFIFGHLHQPLDTSLPDGARLVVLGDWITRFNYAVWDGNTLSTHDYTDAQRDGK